MNVKIDRSKRHSCGWTNHSPHYQSAEADDRRNPNFRPCVKDPYKSRQYQPYSEKAIGRLRQQCGYGRSHLLRLGKVPE